MLIIQILLSRKISAGGGVVGLICMALPFVDMAQYNSFCDHKNRISLENPIVTNIGHVDDVYYSGSNTIKFKLKAYFDKYDVSSFNTATLVYQNNICKGCLKTEFCGDVETATDKGSYTYVESYFQANTDKELYFTVEEHSFIDDDFFYLIYNNYSNLIFKTEILCTFYRDGTTVGRWSDVGYCYYDANGVKHNDFKD